MRHLIDTCIEADEPRKISPFDNMGLLELIVKTGIANAITSQLGGLKLAEPGLSEASLLHSFDAVSGLSMAHRRGIPAAPLKRPRAEATDAAVGLGLTTTGDMVVLAPPAFVAT
jgi:hypothetical protein